MRVIAAGIFAFGSFLTYWAVVLFMVWVAASAVTGAVKMGLDKCDAHWPIDRALSTGWFCESNTQTP